MTAPRLGRGRAVLLVLVLGLALLGTALPTWASATTPTMTGVQEVTVAGTEAAPGVASAGAVVLVAALVLGLSGRVTRLLAIVGVVLGGVMAVVSAAQVLADPTPALLAQAASTTGVAQLQGDPVVTALPTVSVVLGAVVGLAGFALPFVLGSWQQVGRRYERGGPEQPAAARPGGRRRAMDDWDALSRGEDPSEDRGAP